MQTKILGVNQSGAEVNLLASEGGLLAGLPYQVLWTAKGYGFQAMATAAVAALVIRPSTLSIATLRNASTDKVYVMERAFAHNLVAAAQSDYNIWLCLHPSTCAVGTDEITVRNRTNGAVAGGSSSTFENAATVVADGWFPWGGAYTTVTVTTPGGLLVAEIGGRLIVPPNCAISISVTASVNTATFCCGFHWFEVPESELAIG